MESMYFVAVVLPAELDEKILVYKKLMHEKYACKVGLKSPAHITLVPPFWMDVESEAEFKSDVEKIALSITAFQIATNNFSAFKPRTLFVAVQDNETLNKLKKSVAEFFSTAGYKIKKENRPFHPHITIATRDLHKKAFADAWPQFEAKKFAEEFEAVGLSLLKHNGRTWDVLFTARFNKQ